MKRLVAITIAILATAALAVEGGDARPCGADRTCDGNGPHWAAGGDGEGWGHRWMRGDGEGSQHRWGHRWRHQEDRGSGGDTGRAFVDEDGDGICDHRDTEGWQGRGKGRRGGR